MQGGLSTTNRSPIDLVNPGFYWQEVYNGKRGQKDRGAKAEKIQKVVLIELWLLFLLLRGMTSRERNGKQSGYL